MLACVRRPWRIDRPCLYGRHLNAVDLPAITTMNLPVRKSDQQFIMLAICPNIPWIGSSISPALLLITNLAFLHGPECKTQLEPIQETLPMFGSLTVHLMARSLFNSYGIRCVYYMLYVSDTPVKMLFLIIHDKDQC